MRVDLNADLGEGFGRWRLTDDAGLMRHVTSANVACGFHAGDPPTMARVARSAAGSGVVVGAQVGYRDLAGFGRRAIDVDPDELEAEVRYQVGALAAFADVRYVKPHGALYHRCADDERQAAAVVAAVRAWPRPLAVLGLPGSALLRLATAEGLRAVPEGFPDRAYDGDRLRPRNRPGAVLDDPDAVAVHALELARRGDIASLCVHGDTPGAVETAARVRAALREAGVDVVAFA